MRTAREEAIVPYNQDSAVLCTCGTLLRFGQLIVGEGNTGVGAKGSSWKSTYYHCPDCNRVVVYDPGDGYASARLVNGTTVGKQQ